MIAVLIAAVAVGYLSVMKYVLKNVSPSAHSK